MPNWVTNSIEITGTSEAIAAIGGDLLIDGQPTFQALLPRPADQEDNWYDWNVEHWGTKWDVTSSSVDHETGRLAVEFDTAWSPPMPWIHALADKHPDVTIIHTWDEEQGFGEKRQRSAGSTDWELLDEWDVPDSHAEVERRGQDCWCETTDPVYYDCFAHLAKQDGVDSKIVEAMTTLGRDGWDGTYEELLTTASKL